MTRFRDQAARFGAEFLTRKAKRVDFSSRPFRIWTESTEGEPDILAQVLIVSTGARAVMLDVPGEARLIGHGVSTCATCDGFFFRNQKIVVVGGGDSALEEASFLTRFGESVTVVHRRKVVTEVLGDGKVSGVALTNIVTGEQSTFDTSGVFVAIGHVPNTSVFAGELDMDENGYIQTTDGTRTNVDGVFACGDVQDHIYRQAITSAGSGCMAAIDAERWLEAKGEA
jgi:thioredoxin reductase (NADPH)